METNSLDADLSDILDNLDFAAVAIVDARYGRYVSSAT